MSETSAEARAARRRRRCAGTRAPCGPRPGRAGRPARSRPAPRPPGCEPEEAKATEPPSGLITHAGGRGVRRRAVVPLARLASTSVLRARSRTNTFSKARWPRGGSSRRRRRPRACLTRRSTRRTLTRCFSCRPERRWPGASSRRRGRARGRRSCRRCRRRPGWSPGRRTRPAGRRRRGRGRSSAIPLRARGPVGRLASSVRLAARSRTWMSLTPSVSPSPRLFAVVWNATLEPSASSAGASESRSEAPRWRRRRGWPGTAAGGDVADEHLDSVACWPPALLATTKATRRPSALMAAASTPPPIAAPLAPSWRLTSVTRPVTRSRTKPRGRRRRAGQGRGRRRRTRRTGRRRSPRTAPARGRPRCGRERCPRASPRSRCVRSTGHAGSPRPCAGRRRRSRGRWQRGDRLRPVAADRHLGGGVGDRAVWPSARLATFSDVGVDVLDVGVGVRVPVVGMRLPPCARKPTTAPELSIEGAPASSAFAPLALMSTSAVVPEVSERR